MLLILWILHYQTVPTASAFGTLFDNNDADMPANGGPFTNMD